MYRVLRVITNIFNVLIVVHCFVLLVFSIMHVIAKSNYGSLVIFGKQYFPNGDQIEVTVLHDDDRIYEIGDDISYNVYSDGELRLVHSKVVSIDIPIPDTYIYILENGDEYPDFAIRGEYVRSYGGGNFWRFMWSQRGYILTMIVPSGVYIGYFLVIFIISLKEKSDYDKYVEERRRIEERKRLEQLENSDNSEKPINPDQNQDKHDS